MRKKIPSKSNDADRTLSTLLTELEGAVRAKDGKRTAELHRLILQRLATETAELAAAERRVQELVAALNESTVKSAAYAVDNLMVERGDDSNEDGVVYPVWFGTNRMPEPDGIGFTSKRHNKVTTG